MNKGLKWAIAHALKKKSLQHKLLGSVFLNFLGSLSVITFMLNLFSLLKKVQLFLFYKFCVHIGNRVGPKIF